MSSSPVRYLSVSEAAKRLGVSSKALRLYEQRGLVVPGRTAAGYRSYGPEDIAQAAEVVALRRLGLSLGQVERIRSGQPELLETALAIHQATLEGQASRLDDTIDKVRNLRSDLAKGQAPAVGRLPALLGSAADLSVAFELPWPWDGELFELSGIRSLNYIVGPLGCGKTKLAMRLAETPIDAAFLGLERLSNDGSAAHARLNTDPILKSRVDQVLSWLVDEGGTVSDPLVVLLAGLESVGPNALVVDMIEEGLDEPTQEALITYLRHRANSGTRLIFFSTRSSAILDLASLGPNETVILCPANHSPPTVIAPYPGAPGYESVATCLASPSVRARTAGVVALRSNIA
jgi:DNA-binding transcriptional MerR regulator